MSNLYKMIGRVRSSLGMKRSVALVAAMLSGMMIATGAQAQAYPSKPIRLIVPFAPGLFSTRTG